MAEALDAQLVLEGRLFVPVQRRGTRADALRIVVAQASYGAQDVPPRERRAALLFPGTTEITTRSPANDAARSVPTTGIASGGGSGSTRMATPTGFEGEVGTDDDRGVITDEMVSRSISRR